MYSAATDPDTETAYLDRTVYSAATDPDTETAYLDRTVYSAATDPDTETAYLDRTVYSAATDPDTETLISIGPCIAISAVPNGTKVINYYYQVPWLLVLPVRTFFTMEGGDCEFANFTLPTLKAFFEARSHNVS